MSPVYLDAMGHLWSADREALHALAAKAGMRRDWFQDRVRLYHYDVLTQGRRLRALREGAIPVTARQLVHLIQENDKEPVP